MLISKFNKLIRNKFIWAIFAILVSLSMVGLFAPQPRDEGNRERGIGTLFGREVSREDLVRARAFAQAFQASRGGEEVQQQIDEEAWGRLAILHYADQLGLRVSNDEIVQTIQRDPSFSENGSFSMLRYQQLVQQQLGIPVSLFEDYIREEILINRVRDLIDTGLWIAASEIEENAARFTDTFSIAYVLLAPDTELDLPPVTDENALQIYNDEPNLFIKPEQRSVLYVAFEHDAFLQPDLISDRLIQTRYDANPERFTFTDPETEVSIVRPLHEVSDEIRQELALQEAMAAASERSMQVVDELSLAEIDRDMRLRDIAAEMNIPVYTSVLFQASGPAPADVSAGNSFVQAAFRLSPTNPAQSFSFSIPGTNAVYVLQLHETVEAFLPPFEDVAAQAHEAALAATREKLFSDYVDEIHQRFSAAAIDAEAFHNIAEAEGLSVTEIKPFSLYDADPRDIPFFGDLAPEVLPLQTGELSTPIRTNEGTVIAFLQERTAGSFEERMAIKPDVARMMLDGLDRIHFSAWIDTLLEEARRPAR